ncbi:hypothetical protein QCE83_00005, partial [Caballeronia sp. LZ034LL]|nr:hypothetical protein [Caballeronia sp. LZ034LL]
PVRSVTFPKRPVTLPKSPVTIPKRPVTFVRNTQFTPILRRQGRPVLDGGMVDNVPVSALDAAPGLVLVMVTRLYPRERMFVVPHGAQRRVYIQPSRKVPISSWDYTSPSQMQHAYDLGRADADDFLERLPRLMETASQPV